MKLFKVQIHFAGNKVLCRVFRGSDIWEAMDAALLAFPDCLSVSD
jgi:hypothetical protein